MSTPASDPTGPPSAPVSAALARAPRRSIIGRVGFAAAAIVSIAAVLAVAALHERTGASRAAADHLDTIRLECVRLDGDEWRMMSRGAIEPDVLASMLVSRGRIESAMEALEASRAPAIDLPRLSDAYVACTEATRPYLHALAAGRMSEARRLDETQVDPARRRFEAEVERAHAAYAVWTERQHRAVDALSGALVALAMLVGGTLALRSQRARASEARVLAAEEVSRAGVQRMHALLRRSDEVLVVLDAAGRVLDAGPSSVHLLSVHPDDLRGRAFDEVAVEADRESLRAWIGSARTSPGATTFRALVDGVERVFEAWLDDDGAGRLGTGRVLHARDVTARRAAEAEAAELERQYAALFDAVPKPMLVADADTLRFLAVNRAAVERYGWTPEEFLGLSVPDIRPAGDFPAPLDRIEADSSRGIRGEWRHRSKDGAVFPVDVQARPLRFGGRPAYLLIVADLSERKQLEKQVRQSQRMDAIGRLAGGVAHDFNNLLTAIAGYAQLLHPRLASDAEAGHYADEIVRAAGRAGTLTRQLLAFSRQQVLHPVVLDLNEIVGNTRKMLQRLIGEHIEVVFEPAAGLGHVKADPGQIEHVVVNLALNARDAMPNGGRLEIRTSNVDLDEAWAHRHEHVPPGPYVRLAITDTGIGMTEAVVSRVFEPFFTTKEPGRGTGLGLAVVYGIVRQSGGAIRVHSAPGRGTTFEIDLPRVESAAAEQTAPRDAPHPRGGERILVVEDEDVVRRLVAELLGSLGYSVRTAADGRAALSELRERAGELDLVISDVVMPGMGGRETAERAREIRPDLRVLFMSGYTDDAVVRQGVIEDGAPFLQKPFTVGELARTVRAALDGPAPGPRAAA